MKNYLLCICLVFFVITAKAQETDAIAGAYGYTSVDFDPDTNTVTVYAETDVDSTDSVYYSVEINTGISDSQGTISVAAKDSPNCSVVAGEVATATVNCRFTAIPNDVFTAVSFHYLDNYVSDPAGSGQYLYDDVEGYNTFASVDYESPFDTIYTPPYQFAQVKSQRMSLGRTFDSKGTATPPVCGDVRDNLLFEYYKTPGTVFRPICADLTSPSTWLGYGAFTFDQLTPTQTTGKGAYAILQPYLGSDLQNVIALLQNSPALNSVYRNPAKEASVGRYYPDSRHMAGDAVDLDTGNSEQVYSQQKTAATKVDSPCVEPVDPVYGPQKKYDHTHIDWRVHGPANFPGPSSCPPRW